MNPHAESAATQMPNLPMEVFAELLLRLNRVWRTREGKRLDRQRAKASRRVDELRRQLRHATPYEDVMQTSEVQRLRRELKEMRTAFNSGRRKVRAGRARRHAPHGFSARRRTPQPLPSPPPPARAPQLNETEERLLEKSLETALELESRLQDHERRAEAHRTEKAELGRRIASAFARGASSAAALATEVSDRLAERVTELMREFQRKTLHLNRQARLQRHPALRAPAPSSRTARERSGPPPYHTPPRQQPSDALRPTGAGPRAFHASAPAAVVLPRGARPTAGPGAREDGERLRDSARRQRRRGLERRVPSRRRARRDGVGRLREGWRR